MLERPAGEAIGPRPRSASSTHRIVRPEQRPAVVVAVGGTHQRVRMPPAVAGVGQRYSRLVVEFDEDHRIIDTVVEGTDRIELADPAEHRLRQMPHDLVEPLRVMAGGQTVDVQSNEVDKPRTLLRRHVTCGQSRKWDDDVVLEARSVAVERKFISDDGPGALLRPQRSHKGEALRLFLAQHAGAGIEARLGLDRFGTEQHRREYDLVSQYKAIDVA